MSDVKDRLECVQKKLREAKEEVIKKKTERDSLQDQLRELEEQIKDEFDLEPIELPNRISELEKEVEKNISEIEEFLNKIPSSS